MKANPMQTAPRDGRKIIVITKSDRICRVRWCAKRNEWSCDELNCSYTNSFCLGWVEDIKPPEPPQLKMNNLTIQKGEGGGLDFAYHFRNTEWKFDPTEVALLREFLNNNE